MPRNQAFTTQRHWDEHTIRNMRPGKHDMINSCNVANVDLRNVDDTLPPQGTCFDYSLNLDIHKSPITPTSYRFENAVSLL